MLRIANVEVPAVAELTQSGNRKKLTLRSDGKVIDEEVYDVTTEEISLVQLGTRESFSPPIPLLRFPMRLGTPLEWHGQVLLAAEEISGTATIGSESDRVDLPTGATESVLVTVSLSLGDGAERKLRIWFAAGEGPIKRDFGSQIREPRGSN